MQDVNQSARLPRAKRRRFASEQPGIGRVFRALSEADASHASSSDYPIFARSLLSRRPLSDTFCRRRRRRRRRREWENSLEEIKVQSRGIIAYQRH